MLQVKINIKNTIASINNFKKRVPVRMRVAVRNTARIMLSRIVEKTPAPPTPPGQVYIRTGRLREGWQPSLKELGMGVPRAFPPPRAGYYGSPPRDINLPFRGFEEKVGPSEISFLMRNNVPYALFVELVGPGFRPPSPVLMVTKSSFETESDFEREVQVAWNAL